MGIIKEKQREYSITFLLTKSVYYIGLGILGIGISELLFISVIARNQFFKTEVFAKIEGIMFFGYFALVLLLTFLVPFLASRKLKKNGQAIMDIIEKIENQDLDFHINYGNIKEINLILDSMNHMRDALKESLENQWRMEQNRVEQISALAHDFKTPMTVLKGNMELMEAANIDDSICREYINDAKCSVDTMERYLNQLLEMARAEKGYVMNNSRYELVSLIKEIAFPLIRIAKEKNIKIDFNFEEVDKEIFVFVDKLLFERMINNIISNALDFTESEGSIIIEVYESDNNAIITITDSGCGFNESTLKHGLEQFYMGDSSRGRKNHYGLGLFIASSIAKQHNGSMKLSNDEIKGGAKITISIPIIK